MMKFFFACLYLHFSEKRSLGKKLMQIFKRVILIRSNTRMYHAITCFWSRSKTIKSHLYFCPEPYQVFLQIILRTLTTYYEIYARPKNTKYLIWERMTLLWFFWQGLMFFDVFEKTTTRQRFLGYSTQMSFRAKNVKNEVLWKFYLDWHVPKNFFPPFELVPTLLFFNLVEIMRPN